jgi:predicted Zn-dependent protease
MQSAVQYPLQSVHIPFILFILLTVDIANLRKMLGTPRDSAMLRLTLARALAERGEKGGGDLEEAQVHLDAALAMDGSYTAAWKELGRIRLLAEKPEDAAAAWAEGIGIARKNGDKQAEKEMAVFLKRLQRMS